MDSAQVATLVIPCKVEDAPSQNLRIAARRSMRRVNASNAVREVTWREENALLLTPNANPLIYPTKSALIATKDSPFLMAPVKYQKSMKNSRYRIVLPMMISQAA